MKRPSEPIEEIVWTGTSDRQVQGQAESDEPMPTSPPPDPRPATPRPPAATAQPPAPAPAPPAAAAATPANQSRALAETVVASFLDRLTAEAARKGGSLTVQDIQGLNKEFEKKTQALQAVFEKSFEEYVRARERAVWDQKRDFPFDRQLVDRFAHLFPARGDPSLKDGAVSRRVLPGFFVALNLMLGADLIESYQERCRAIVARLKEQRGDAFSWEDVDNDKEVNGIVLDTVIGIANHFEAAEKRSGWFLGMINDHLGPPNPGEGEEAATWQLTERDFARFLSALFSVARETMTTESGRLTITKRHGADTCAMLFDILKRLDEMGLG